MASRLSRAAAPRALPARGGIGLKPEHFDCIRQQRPDIGFFEIHAENYLVAGGPMHHHLERIRADYPLSIHGVGLAIGGAAPLDETHLDRLAALLARYQPESFSEHLAWSSHGGAFLNDLLPLPYNRRTLARVCGHIDQVQSRLGRLLLLENPATYLEFVASTMSETEFIAEVLRRTGCGLLLDVNNVHVACTNHGRDARAYVAALPLAAVAEIHLAGFAEDVDAAGDRLLIDSHDAPVAEAVWDLYAYVLRLRGPVATLIERDGNIPPLAVLQAEASWAELVMADCRLVVSSRARPAALVPPAMEAEPLATDGDEGFAAALWSADGLPAGLTAWNGSDPARRFAIHRNNVWASLVDALAASFPVVATLVGDEFFRAMAGVYARCQPPASPVLAEYGAGFADFIADFPPAAGLPYLADVARLEWLLVRSRHAAEAPALAPSRLQALLAQPQRLAATGLRFHPSVALLSSAYAVTSLWGAHQGPGAPPATDPWQAESALVLRQGLTPVVRSLDPGAAAFAGTLLRGASLGAAAAAAMALDASLDVAAILALLIRQQALTDLITTGDLDHEHEHGVALAAA